MSSTASTTSIEELRAAISPVQIRSIDDSYAVDAELPEIVAAPADEGEIARVLCEARKGGIAVIAVGGGTRLGIGNVPSAYDVALSTVGLRETIDHEPDDLTVTVDAGVPFDDLQAKLAERGQTLPIDPPAAVSATVGGAVAADAYGPLRHAHGTLRDWVIGMRVAGVDGAVTKSGGRVVKNVTGYDMHKLHIGALGTLGVITQVTFKLAPLPRVEETAIALFDSAANACALIVAARDAGLALMAGEVLSPPASHAVVDESRWCALMRLGGSHAAVERSLRDLRIVAGDLGGVIDVRESADVWPRWYAAFGAATLSVRCSVLPSQGAETLDVLDRRFSGAAPLLSATVAMGLIRANLEPGRIRAGTLVEHAREAVERRGGAMVIDAAPVSLKRDLDVFGPLRSDFATMRRIKDQFDPGRTLSPGRFMGRL